MSTVYFHSPSGDAELSGAERAHAAFVAEITGAAMLCPHAERLGLGSFYKEPGLFRIAASERPLVVAGEKISGWQVLLNTAIAAGSDPVCFLARLHGQCEIHGWIAGEDRAWLAGIIKDGLESGVMRGQLRGHSMGWDSVIALLESNSSEPVVMSYSVCESFPRMSLWKPDMKVDGDGEPDADISDAWDAMTDAEQFAACMPAIAAMQIKPGDLRTEGFGHGMSALDVLAKL